MAGAVMALLGYVCNLLSRGDLLNMFGGVGAAMAWMSL